MPVEIIIGNFIKEKTFLKITTLQPLLRLFLPSAAHVQGTRNVPLNEYTCGVFHSHPHSYFLSLN